MTRKEVAELLNRIKSHYSTFKIDEYKMDDWYGQLESFSKEDVHKKFEQHLRSEIYGGYEPKISFLISGLLTFEEKNSSKGCLVKCQLCGNITNLENYNKHYSRCSSVKYLNEQSIRFFGKKIDEEKYMKMSEEDFKTFYYKMLTYEKNNTSNPIEYKLIKNIFETRDGGTIQFDMSIFENVKKI